jgi:hypothetical protein
LLNIYYLELTISVTLDLWRVNFDWNIIMEGEEKTSRPFSLPVTDWKKLNPTELKAFKDALGKLLESKKLSDQVHS